MLKNFKAEIKSKRCLELRFLPHRKHDIAPLQRPTNTFSGRNKEYINIREGGTCSN